MRLSNETRYPHPVLGPLTNDYNEGQFNVSFSAIENVESGAVTLNYQILLDELSISELVESGKAAIGCIVVCRDTYYNRLHKLSLTKGILEFQAGKLINKVTIRPVIWLNEATQKLNSPAIHEEFGSEILIFQGDIIAIDEQSTLNIGKAKLAALESIFELTQSPDLEEGRIEIKLDCEKISILLAPKTFKVINLLRGQDTHRSLVMSSIYLPAVMEILDQLRSNSGDYTDRRWYLPFIAKCDAKGIVLNENTPLLECAQALLEKPISKLEDIFSGESHES
ncbi:hypothetical protein [Pseudomonas sp. EA_65y_Pfl2_P78]|uniref:hypothetical protein n=1 Tax=Pseudomonas sp. EA_65y_Pfl2_P78 TaxID=3088695 RepID=UPI0030DC6846